MPTTADASFGPPACSLQPTAYPWHPHIHALVSEGVFLPDLSACGHAQADGAFLPLPKLAIEPFLKLWEQEVFALLLAEGKTCLPAGRSPRRSSPTSGPGSTRVSVWIRVFDSKPAIRKACSA
jgi:hypothetical protein